MLFTTIEYLCFLTRVGCYTINLGVTTLYIGINAASMGYMIMSSLYWNMVRERPKMITHKVKTE